MAGPRGVHPTGRGRIVLGFILIVIAGVFVLSLIWWLGHPETSPWTEGRWRLAVPLVIAVTIGTWAFWLLSDPLMMMAAIFMPHITLGIPAGIAVVLAIASKGDPEFKSLWKWYGLILLTIFGATVALFPLAFALEHLPQWEECRFKVTLAVDTPDGMRTASNVYRIKSNRIAFLRQSVHGSRSMQGGNFVLDLGPRGRVDVALAKGKAWEFLHYPEEAFGRLEYRDGKTEGRVELTGKVRPVFTGERGGETKTLRPEDFESFFGPGVRFHRVWLEMTDDPVRK